MTVASPILNRSYPQWGQAAPVRNPIRAAYSQPIPRNPLLQNYRAPYRFAVIGDAGTGDQSQYAVARQLSLYQQYSPFNSVMVLGDNVYQNGEPALFQERIARPYQDLFQRGVRFFPVLGNHDVKRGFENWQLAYWGVPRFYNYKLGTPGSDVEFWALDTNLLTPGLKGDRQDNPWLKQQQANNELFWLKKSLASSTATMKVVYGHHPLYSRGAAAKPARAFQQQVLAQKLDPLFQKYGVDLYMAGHEHHYEKPVMTNGVYHLVSGAAGKLDTPYRGSQEGNGLIKQLHFMLFEMTPQGLVYQAISSEGKLLDRGNIPRKSMPGYQLNTYA